MAILLAQVPTTTNLLPKRPAWAYSAGIKDADKAFVKYGPPSTDQPNLIINEAIRDDGGNTIMPGFYELILSPTREMLSLSQAGTVVATFPVFKYEEDKSQEELAQPMDNKSQKKFNKEQKKKDKKTKKLIKQGKMPEEPPIYTNATIKYDVEGDYYLIKYERGKIRAWGAIKNSEW